MRNSIIIILSTWILPLGIIYKFQHEPKAIAVSIVVMLGGSVLLYLNKNLKGNMSLIKKLF